MDLLPYCYPATVLRVTSGDSLQVELDLGFGIYTKVHLRLEGYKAPLHYQPGFELATTYLKDLLRRGRILVHPVSREAPGIWYAQVYAPGGHSAADLMNEFATNLLIKSKHL